MSSEDAYERLENENYSDRSDEAEDYALSHDRSESNQNWLSRGGMNDDNDESLGGARRREISHSNEDNEVNTDNEGDIDQMMDVDEG